MTMRQEKLDDRYVRVERLDAKDERVGRIDEGETEWRESMKEKKSSGENR